MFPFFKASDSNMFLNAVQIKMRHLITVFTFTVLVVWSWGIALVA